MERENKSRKDMEAGQEVLRAQARDMFIEGSTFAQIAEHCKVPVRTIYNWHKRHKWDDSILQEVELEREILEQAKQTLLVGMKRFRENPKDQDLQSLVFMLKDLRRNQAPAKELNNYIVKFQSQVIDFCCERGYDDLRVRLQEVTHDLAEYLRSKNNG